MMSAMATRVFLLDDHEVVRRGVRELLEEAGFEIAGEASTAAEALARIPPTKPDVAVLDVRLPDGNGVEVCREVRDLVPGLACLMLTSYSDDEALFEAIMAGASGYVLKQIRGNDLVDAINTVAAGKSLLDPAATDRLMRRLRDTSPEDERIASLTDQERKLLDLLAAGPDEPRDRRPDVPRREDGQELRVEPPGQDGHAAAHRSRGVRRPAGGAKSEAPDGRLSGWVRDRRLWTRSATTSRGRCSRRHPTACSSSTGEARSSS